MRKVTNELAKLEERTITMKLAEQIRKHRKENNLTQDQLATELHTTRQTVSKWEQGTIEPNVQMIVQLAQRFDISTDELLTGQTSHPYKEKNHNHILNI